MSDSEPTPTEHAARVSRAVSLVGLRLVEIHGELLDGRDHDNYLVDLQVDLSPELAEETLTYGVRFTLTLRPTGAESTTGDDEGAELTDDVPPAYTGTGTFQLLYDVGGDIDPDDLQAFGEISSIYSAWPYARELFTTLTARAGLTPLVLRSFLAPVVDR